MQHIQLGSHLVQVSLQKDVMDQNMYRLYKMSKIKNMWVMNNEASLSNEMINTLTDASYKEFI